MVFSHLYSAIARGKWFIAFREADVHLPFVQKLFTRGIDEGPGETLSDRQPMMAYYIPRGTSAARKSATYSDAPEGSVAVIQLCGTMLKYGTYCSYGTTEVANQMIEAADAENIDAIILAIDSGGGAVDAIAPLVDAISYCHNKGKAVVAHCDLCASAAYYVACYCDSIVADNDISSEFGSIGVMMQFADYAKYYADHGIKVHTIYSSLSDYKNAPFEAAMKGEYKMIIDEELDPLAREFQAAVKSNRKTLVDTEGLLRGRMFYARDAAAFGLIDDIGSLDFAVARAKELNAQATINEYMNLFN